MKSKLFLLLILLAVVNAFAKTQEPRESPRQETDGDIYKFKIAQIRKTIQNRKPDDADLLDQGAKFVFNNHPSRTAEKRNSAQIAKARVLHLDFYDDRTNKVKAEKAITEYKKVLAQDITNQKAFNAVADIYFDLNQTDNRKKWINERAENPKVPADQRAEAYMILAARENTCANDITEMPEVKKFVQKYGKPMFIFTKPANPKDLETLKNCVQRGTTLINKAIALNKESDNAWSYKTSFLIQSARLAEMEGLIADKNKLNTEIADAKAKFIQLAEIRKKRQDDKNKDFLEALEWINTSVKIKETFDNLSLKASLLAELGRFKEAVETGEKAVQIGKNSTPPTNTTDFERTLADWKTNSYVEPLKEVPLAPPIPKS